MTENKSTYEKTFGSGNLFSESGFDEMQRAESYSIAFKVFRTSFWLHLFLAAIIVCVGVYKINDALSVAGAVYYIVNLLIYNAYAAMSAAKGILPDKFAKGYRSKRIVPLWTLITVLWIVGQDEIYISMIWVSTSIYQIIMFFIVKHNDKVLKKQIEEDSEE